MLITTWSIVPQVTRVSGQSVEAEMCGCQRVPFRGPLADRRSISLLNFITRCGRGCDALRPIDRLVDTYQGTEYILRMFTQLHLEVGTLADEHERIDRGDPPITTASDLDSCKLAPLPRILHANLLLDVVSPATKRGTVFGTKVLFFHTCPPPLVP